MWIANYSLHNHHYIFQYAETLKERQAISKETVTNAINPEQAVYLVEARSTQPLYSSFERFQHVSGACLEPDADQTSEDGETELGDDVGQIEEECRDGDGETREENLRDLNDSDDGRTDELAVNPKLLSPQLHYMR